jgi:hypothetical protein
MNNLTIINHLKLFKLNASNLLIIPERTSGIQFLASMDMIFSIFNIISIGIHYIEVYNVYRQFINLLLFIIGNFLFWLLSFFLIIYRWEFIIMCVIINHYSVSEKTHMVIGLSMNQYKTDEMRRDISVYSRNILNDRKSSWMRIIISIFLLIIGSQYCDIVVGEAEFNTYEDRLIRITFHKSIAKYDKLDVRFFFNNKYKLILCNGKVIKAFEIITINENTIKGQSIDLNIVEIKYI